MTGRPLGMTSGSSWTPRKPRTSSIAFRPPTRSSTPRSRLETGTWKRCGRSSRVRRSWRPPGSPSMPTIARMSRSRSTMWREGGTPSGTRTGTSPLASPTVRGHPAARHRPQPGPGRGRVRHLPHEHRVGDRARRGRGVRRPGTARAIDVRPFGCRQHDVERAGRDRAAALARKLLRASRVR